VKVVVYPRCCYVIIITIPGSWSSVLLILPSSNVMFCQAGKEGARSVSLSTYSRAYVI